MKNKKPEPIRYYGMNLECTIDSKDRLRLLSFLKIKNDLTSRTDTRALDIIYIASYLFRYTGVTIEDHLTEMVLEEIKRLKVLTDQND